MKELEEDCGCGHEEREGKMAKYSAIECAEDAMDIAMNKVKDYMTHYVRGAESRPMHNKATDMTLKGVLKGALKGK